MAGRTEHIFHNTYWTADTFAEDECYAYERPIYHSKIQQYIEERMDPFNAERGCNFTYSSQSLRGLELTEELEQTLLAESDETIEYMLDPVSGSAAKGKKVIGIICIHVDDILFCGAREFSNWQSG